MSGSLVLRSGVGTQILMVSSSRTAEKSVVARILPASTRGPRVELGISPMYESPAFTRLVLASLISIPVTVKPALANSTARGRPTYPSPIIPTRAVRVRIFSSRTLAVASMATSGCGMEQLFSHSDGLCRTDGRPVQAGTFALSAQQQPHRGRNVIQI